MGAIFAAVWLKGKLSSRETWAECLRGESDFRTDRWRRVSKSEMRMRTGRQDYFLVVT